ncbi:hypothetical protein EXU57_04055 [Segetibacter sp. 3557_3]|nr:hypothetical protein EXU57_04055 [Segetibacter sp. 3557_3]
MRNIISSGLSQRIASLVYSQQHSKGLFNKDDNHKKIKGISKGIIKESLQRSLDLLILNFQGCVYILRVSCGGIYRSAGRWRHSKAFIKCATIDVEFR